MALRYITGRSGQGKTEYLVKEANPPFYRDSGKTILCYCTGTVQSGDAA